MSATQSSTPASQSPTSSAWIFQANPRRYRIHEALLEQRQDFWNLNQHARDVRLGDRVMIWVCGEDAGIYAVGTIMSDPIIMSDSPVGINYWYKPGDGRRPKARVLVRFDRVLLERPLLKVYLEADPALWKLSILASPRGTNFRVSEEEWQALRTWLEG